MNPYPTVLRRIVQAGFGVLPILVWGLWLWSPLGFWGCVYLALLLELLPILGLAQLPLADDEGPFPRIPVYLSSGAIILLLGWGGLLIGTAELGRAAMGLEAPEVIPLLSWTLAAALGILAVQLAFLLGRVRFGIRETSLLHQLLPRTLPEKVVFAFLSLAAGVGEEVAFRGFAIPGLALLTGSSWGAAIISSLAFGLLHGYQGWLGVARTGAMGLVLAGVFLVSGTLWPAILAHALLDLVTGLILGDTLLREV
jgi:membrane protease YdiL (CAAX protease family)